MKEKVTSPDHNSKACCHQSSEMKLQGTAQFYNHWAQVEKALSSYHSLQVQEAAELISGSYMLSPVLLSPPAPCLLLQAACSRTLLCARCAKPTDPSMSCSDCENKRSLFIILAFCLFCKPSCLPDGSGAYHSQWKQKRGIVSFGIKELFSLALLPLCRNDTNQWLQSLTVCTVLPNLKPDCVYTSCLSSPHIPHTPQWILRKHFCLQLIQCFILSVLTS